MIVPLWKYRSHILSLKLFREVMLLRYLFIWLICFQFRNGLFVRIFVFVKDNLGDTHLLVIWLADMCMHLYTYDNI